MIWRAGIGGTEWTRRMKASPSTRPITKDFINEITLHGIPMRSFDDGSAGGRRAQGGVMRRSSVAFATVLLLGAVAVPVSGGEVKPWKPDGISSPLFESHAAFDPRNGDLYFVRSS